MRESWPVRHLVSISCKRQDCAIGLPLLLRPSKKKQITCGVGVRGRVGGEARKRTKEKKEKLYLGTVCERIKNTWILSPVYSFGPKTDYGVMLVIYVVCLKRTYLPLSSWRLTWGKKKKKRRNLVCSYLKVQPLLTVCCVSRAFVRAHVCVCAFPPSDFGLAWHNNASPPPLSFTADRQVGGPTLSDERITACTEEVLYIVCSTWM